MKPLILLALLITLPVCSCGGGPEMMLSVSARPAACSNPQNWTTPGTYRCSIPAGVTTITVEAGGGGGGGGGGNTSGDCSGVQNGTAGSNSTLAYSAIVEATGYGGGGGGKACSSGGSIPGSVIGLAGPDLTSQSGIAGGGGNYGAGGSGAFNGGHGARGGLMTGNLTVAAGGIITAVVGAKGTGGASVNSGAYPGADGSDGSVKVSW